MAGAQGVTMAAVAERHEALASPVRRVPARPGVRTGQPASGARAGVPALPRSRVSDDARRRVAVHERRAHRGDDVRARARGLGRRQGDSAVPLRRRVRHGRAGQRPVRRRACRRLARCRPASRSPIGPDTRRPRSGRCPRAPFADLNTAFFEDAVTIRVAPRTVVTTPLHVLSLTVGGRRPRARRAAAVDSRRRGRAGLGHRELRRPRRGLDADDRRDAGSISRPAAMLDHVKIQREPRRPSTWRTLAVWLSRSSTLTSHALTFGGRIAPQRHHRGAGRRGRRVHARRPVRGRRRHARGHAHDDRPRDAALPEPRGLQGHPVRHVPRPSSTARSSSGPTRRRRTPSRRTSALLLSDDAQVNTKPQLEIFADDVKCTHGAAIGQLDEDAMFYLQARGIEPIDARNMLIHAFAGEVLDGDQGGRASASGRCA